MRCSSSSSVTFAFCWIWSAIKGVASCSCVDSSDFFSNDRVAKRGEELLKRKTGGANLESVGLVHRLFLMFIGRALSQHSLEFHIPIRACPLLVINWFFAMAPALLLPGTGPDVIVGPGEYVSPVNSSVKTRMMAIFTRSVAAANAYPYTLHCVVDCISGKSDN